MGLTGMMPILHSPGLMMPGQLGPMSRVFCESFMMRFTLTCTQSVHYKAIAITSSDFVEHWHDNLQYSYDEEV